MNWGPLIEKLKRKKNINDDLKFEIFLIRRGGDKDEGHMGQFPAKSSKANGFNTPLTYVTVQISIRMDFFFVVVVVAKESVGIYNLTKNAKLIRTRLF